MPEDAESARAELEKLRQEYAAHLGSRLQSIEEAASAFREAWDSDKMEPLYQQVHRLSGSAAIYGFEAVTRAAQALETALLACMEHRPGARRRLRGELARLLKELHWAARERSG